MDVDALLQHSQYAIPIGIVLACAILVFVFGFKNAEQPPFAQLTSGSDVDRKPAGKKRNKIKEKSRTVNVQVATEKSSPAKKVVPVKAEAVKKNAAKGEEVGGELKERKHEDNKPVVARKEKAVSTLKSGKENKGELVKNRKNLKNLSQEKPVDFDDGNWESVSRKDKKNKKKDEDSPSKKIKKDGKKAGELITNISKKEKGQAKPEVKDKVAKDTENKELKEKDKKEIVLIPVTNVEPAIEIHENKEEDKELEKIEKPEKPEKLEKVQKAEKIEKSEKSEENKSSSKPKKVKKVIGNENKPSVDVSSPSEKPEKIIEKLEEEKKTKTETAEEKKVEKIEDNKVVFDELGDVWTEAKPQKKSKKKARKDN
ncbi:triadin-like [Diprion similis]|uniref:triadin-like n=1 Tax=Diprion similis TaxID=362088 RepID=UPI001EF7900C|nr:triadin-like [Diprion similis]